MNFKALAPLVATLALGAAPVHAALLVYEGFDYAAGAGSNLNGGTGWNASSVWNNATIGAPGKTYSDLEVSGNTAANPANYDQTRFFANTYGSTPQTIWISFIGQMSATQGGTLTLTNSGFSSSISIGSDWWSQTNWGLYVNGGSQTSASVLNSTFLVMRIDFKDGADDFYLWTDPSLTSEPSIGTANASRVGQLDITLAGLRLISRNGSTTSFDEFRLGDTFADVTPNGIPEPGSATLLGFGLAGTLWMSRRRKTA